MTFTLIIASNQSPELGSTVLLGRVSVGDLVQLVLMSSLSTFDIDQAVSR